MYIPNPLQCYTCFKFGHNEKKIAKKDQELVCYNCGGNGDEHNAEDCKHETKCVNCGEAHTAKSRQCTKWQLEKEVLTVKYKQSISFPEARKIVNARHAPPSVQYSSVVKSGSDKSIVTVDAQTQTSTADIPKQTKESTDQTKDTTKQTQNTKNVPHYTSNKKNSSAPKQKIQIDTGRVKKGSDDPIQIHNRFSIWNRDDEDDWSAPPSSSTKQTTKESRIKRLSTSDEMEN